MWSSVLSILIDFHGNGSYNVHGELVSLTIWVMKDEVHLGRVIGIGMDTFRSTLGLWKGKTQRLGSQRILWRISQPSFNFFYFIRRRTSNLRPITFLWKFWQSPSTLQLTATYLESFSFIPQQCEGWIQKILYGEVWPK